MSFKKDLGMVNRVLRRSGKSARLRTARTTLLLRPYTLDRSSVG